MVGDAVLDGVCKEDYKMIEIENYDSDILNPNDKKVLRELNISFDDFRHNLIWTGKSKRKVLIMMVKNDR